MRLILLLFLAGCQALPLQPAGPGSPAISVFPQPLCVAWCSSHITTMRESVLSSSPVTTGAKSVSSSTSQGGQ